ncbi:MAG: FAD-dependent monooxygenase [Pyrinomonadaceae bacterium]|nr:FAD-dependent monooxygenase [Pyrinomonadaceae bacterium]
MTDQRITIVGAGLAGSLLAICLARRGYSVTVFEARQDMRSSVVESGRSINLALSDRGIAALRQVGMDEYMLKEAVPMLGRMIHDTAGGTKLLPYSGREGEYINSVSRAGLNIALMNEAERNPNVRFIFNERCTDYDVASGELSFDSGRTFRPDVTIAADGAGSPIRQAMQRQIPGYEFSSVFLDHGYKELHIPPGPGGGFQLEKNALHIWPRHQFMMIALPNFDGSFTCTLFLAQKATDGPGFDGLKSEAAVFEFFEKEFPDAVPLMPTLIEDFFGNPTGSLGTVKCWPWSADGKALLIGDAAHAVVPFYGQGMNCSFEDVRVLDGLIAEDAATKNGDVDWASVFAKYGQVRKTNTDAIADMAEENFYEMRDRVADPIFQRKRELETRLEQTYPDYFSKYSMVTFREDLPYSIAKARGNAQDELLMEICSAAANAAEIGLDEVMERIRDLDS